MNLLRDEDVVPVLSEEGFADLTNRLVKAETALERLSANPSGADEDDTGDNRALLDSVRTVLRDTREALATCLTFSADSASVIPSQEPARARAATRPSPDRVAETDAIASSLLRTLVEVIPAGVIVSDAEGSVLTTNLAGEAILGSRVVGNAFDPVKGFTPCRPDGIPLPLPEIPLVRALRDGVVTKDLELLIRRADGAEIPVLVGAAPVRGENGRIVAGVLVFQDITGQKRAQEAIRASEEEFRAIFESNALGIAIADVKTGRFVRVNRKLCEISGYSEDEMVGMTFVDITHPDDREYSGYEATVRGEAGGWTSTRRYLRKDGSWVWWEAFGTILHDAAGVPVRSMATVRDVTERRRLDEELRVALEKYRVLVDALPMAITVSDQDGRIVESNQEAQQLLGIDRTEHLQRRITGDEWRIVRPDGTPMPGEEYPSVRALHERHPVRNVEMGIVKEEGEITWISVTAAPIPLEEYGVAIVYGDVTERKKIADALYESEARYRQLYDTSRDGLISTDLDGRCISCNRAFLDLLGYETVEELRGKSHEELTPPGYYEMEMRIIREQTLVRGYSDAYEKEYYRKSGERVPVSLRAWLRRDTSGKPSGMWVIVRDISERKRAEIERERLLSENRRQREFLERLMEHTQVQLAYIDSQFNFVSVNPAYARASGYSADHLIEHNYFDLFPHSENRAIFERVRDSGAVITFRARPSENPDRPQLGTTYWDWSLVPVKNDDGLVQGLVLSLLDVTDRERAREMLQQRADDLEQEVRRRTAELQANEARLRAIFDNAALGIAVADLDGVLVETNLALQRMLGYTSDELVGARFADLTHPDDRAACLVRYREMFAGGKASYQEEKRYVRKDGETIWALLSASLVYDRGHKPRFTVCMVEDITERKLAQQALIQAEKLTLTGRLAAGLAHEINNPLQSVIGCLALADEILPENDEAGNLLHIAIEELDRTASIVTQLRNVNRPSILVERRPTDLNQLLQHVIALVRKQSLTQGVDIVFPVQEGPLTAMVAPDRIEQVFLNLTLNAIEAMPDGGRLEITMREAADDNASRGDPSSAPGGIQISFADSGVGVPQELLPHLFEPFHTSKAEGMGLGLYVTHSIVAEHGGWIEADNRDGGGAIFSVWLPSSPAAA